MECRADMTGNATVDNVLTFLLHVFSTTKTICSIVDSESVNKVCFDVSEVPGFT